MNRSTTARRYAPLVAFTAVLLLIIVVVPSKAPNQAVAAGGADAGGLVAGGNGAVGDAGGTGDPSAVGADGSPAVTDASGNPTTGGSGGTGGPRATLPGGAPAPTTPGGGPPAAQGDTSHCVQGRQFDPAIDYWAPPCVGKFTGTNAGASYPGVTATTIKVVNYYDKGSDAVNAILKAQGAYVSFSDQKTYLAKLQDFINAKYELYGRKIQIEDVQGTCNSIPPDVQCLRNELRGIVKDKQPFAVVWNTSLCSACFDELSQQHVVNIGGWHFTDKFSQARAPYHWDVQQSATSINTAFGQLWCAQLAHKPAKYTTDRNPLDKLSTQTRRLGVISTNDPENKSAVSALKAVLATCGDKVYTEYYYEQDINTAAQQVEAGIAAMQGNGNKANEATTVLCLCDLVAPEFLYNGEQHHNYYPENAIAGTGFMDADKASQAYISTAGCPLGKPCNYDQAFGLSSIEAQEPQDRDAGARVWKAAGAPGLPPFEAHTTTWDYYSLLATLIQAAGPTLTPANADAGVRAYGIRGGGTTGHIARGFPRGSYTWGQDMRLVAWDSNKPSGYNNEPGTFVQVGGARIALGGYKPGEFPK